MLPRPVLGRSTHPKELKGVDDGYAPPCFKNRASISGGGGQPARSARRRKWEHWPGLKQYLGSTPPSKIRHDKDALPSGQPGLCPMLGV